MPRNTVSVARPSVWGNPYSVERFGRELALKLYRNTAQGYWQPTLVKDLPDALAHEAYTLHVRWRSRLAGQYSGHPIDAMRSLLRGRNLACWCPAGAACHVDILLELANA